MAQLTWEQQEVIRKLRSAPGTAYQESDDVNRAIFRDWIRGLVQTQQTKITFVKADGSTREMLCTLNFDKIPAAKIPRDKQDSYTQTNHEVLKVFDLEKQEWRSFRFDRIRAVSAEISFA